MNDKNGEKLKTDTTKKMLVSFYLSTETIETIDDLLFYVRKRLSLENRRKLTKSVFYETCIKIVIEDYNQKGESSDVWKIINQQINK